jgi:uncharacterized protein YxeA
MDGIGFKDDSAFSSAQLSLIVIFIFALIFAAYWLRKNKQKFGGFNSLIESEERYQVKVQKVDTKTSLYQFTNARETYLVMKSAEGVLMLNREIKEDK